MSIQIGHIKTRNKVFLAPMSGVTDLPFRKMAAENGAGLVVSEMIASKELARSRKDMLSKARRDNISPFVIQLAGREAKWMSEGAKIAQDLGCDAIDINMGCPARKVTGSLSGSALMRDLDHAMQLVDATVASAKVPVTLKMRLGWDETSINAPELASRAEQSGVAMIVVHGRTRNQFYKGKADWRAIAAVKDAINIPLIANGDGETIADMREMLNLSKADGVMIGRGAYGRPWLVGEIAEQLQEGTGTPKKTIGQQMILYLGHYNQMITFYGDVAGVLNARKHLGWMVQRLIEQDALSAQEALSWRKTLMSSKKPAEIERTIVALAQFVENRQLAAA